MVPVPKSVLRSVRRLVGVRTDGLVLEMSSNAIRLILQRAGLPSAHAWRRGWAVHALRNGVSETSVRAAAGWSIGGMVSRCTNALSGELAITEFQRSWGPNQQKHQTQFARELLQMGQYTTNQCEVFRGCR